MTQPLTDLQLALAERIDAVLPQTQCRQCDYPDCRAYAEAIASGAARINQCPPGGDVGVARLADITGQPVVALNPQHGAPKPFALAVIDEAVCIGCTLCIQACPVDAIIGAAKQMHVVIASECTGCELCIAPCPVDCISMQPAAKPDVAAQWRARHEFRRLRLVREKEARSERLALKAQAKLDDPHFAAADKQAKIRAALEKSQARQAQPAPLQDEAALKRAKIAAAMERAAALRAGRDSGKE
ncbi:RnfABCDGE type electron transport complex subunit B [Chitinimonas sp.]|uniref:RnfABCDGE type electron transport complex subunit B n=1 Tax=Chitinimonas sp. TaxID=1934313 RepID=UPI0035AFA9DA